MPFGDIWIYFVNWLQKLVSAGIKLKLRISHRLKEMDSSFKKLFQEQYLEFADQLEETFPELEPQLKASLALSEDDRIDQFARDVLPTMANVQGKNEEPAFLLPGVKLPAGTWSTLSENNKKSILSYLGLLCSCALFTVENNEDSGEGSSNLPNFGKDGWKGAMKWYEEMMNQWKDKAAGIDWSSMTSKISSIFGLGSGFGISGEGFKLPEKFMKGHLARLVEELMSDFKPEDFGFSEEDIKKFEENMKNGASGAFEMLMKVYTDKPDIIQKIIERVGNRLKAKIASGKINPKHIAAEAQELMQEFTDNPEFKSLMETMKGMFGFEDPDFARAAGREGSARVAAARDRLKKKLEKKKQAKVAVDSGVISSIPMESIEEIVAKINGNGPTNGKKNKKK
jgi:hypothetical protein